MKGGTVFEVICKECGNCAVKEWIPGMKTADIKDPCPRCGGTDWADRMKADGDKIHKMLYGNRIGRGA
jgi:hypothetical protein